MIDCMEATGLVVNIPYGYILKETVNQVREDKVGNRTPAEAGILVLF